MGKSLTSKNELMGYTHPPPYRQTPGSVTVQTSSQIIFSSRTSLTGDELIKF